MISTIKFGSKQNAYVSSIALYYFWILCIGGWVDRLLTLVTVGKSLLALNYSLFYFSHAIGCFFFAWWFGRINASKPKTIKLIAAVATFSTCLFTIGAAYAPGYWLTAALCLTGFTAGFEVIIIQKFMVDEVPQKKRGSVIGHAFGWALSINFILFILFIPSNTSTIYTKSYASSQAYFAACVFLITGICTILSYPTKEQISASPVNRSPLGTNSFIKPDFIVIFFLICLFFYLNIGIQDCIVSFSWFAGGNFMFFTKVFSIIGAFGAGILCDRKGRYFLILSNLGLLAAGLVSMMFAYQGILAFISFSLVQLAYMGFDISIKLIIIDMAHYSKKPVLIASLGFILPYVIRQFGCLIGSVLQQYGTIPVFVTLVLLIIASAPFLTLFFEKIRNIYINELNKSSHWMSLQMNEVLIAIPSSVAKNTSEDASLISGSVINNFCNTHSDNTDLINQISEKCGLTARETQVLQLILLGQSVSEMAQNLFVSEITVKTHVGRILKKVGVKNRTQLISLILNTQTTTN